MPLLTPTGGLVYHARALRAGERWRPFREALAAWLAEWMPPAEGLLIVGPSGGYTLPGSWLERFGGVVAVDFDPLARRAFERRHPRCRLDRWIHEDALPSGRRGLELESLRYRLAEHPRHAVLFANVLGQLALISSNPEAVEGDLARLRALLRGRAWASVHDRLSSPIPPRLPADRCHRDDTELALAAYSGGEIVSHSTARLGEGLDCATFAWECGRGWWNLIEACRDGASPVENP